MSEIAIPRLNSMLEMISLTLTVIMMNVMLGNSSF